MSGGCKPSFDAAAGAGLSACDDVLVAADVVVGAASVVCAVADDMVKVIADDGGLFDRCCSRIKREYARNK